MRILFGLSMLLAGNLAFGGPVQDSAAGKIPTPGFPFCMDTKLNAVALIEATTGIKGIIQFEKPADGDPAVACRVGTRPMQLVVLYNPDDYTPEQASAAAEHAARTLQEGSLSGKAVKAGESH